MRSIILSDGVARAVVRPDLGAGLACFELIGGKGAVPLFRGAPAKATEPFALAMNLLLPWSGRISGGGFAYGGRFHALAPTLRGEPLPIHGNAFAAAWRAQAVEPASVQLGLSASGPGPYRYRATVGYALDGGALSVALSVTSTADMPLPFGLGLHPWLPRTRLTTLRAGAATVWFEDTRHLPDASAPVSGRPDWDFSAGRGLPGGALHTWFEGWDGRATIAWPERRLALEVEAEPPLSSWVLYSPGPQSGVFCFEPVSHPVDAHNLPEANGLVRLAPGDSVSALARFSPRAL